MATQKKSSQNVLGPSENCWGHPSAVCFVERSVFSFLPKLHIAIFLGGQGREECFSQRQRQSAARSRAIFFGLVFFVFESVLVILIDCIVSCNKFISATPIFEHLKARGAAEKMGLPFNGFPRYVATSLSQAGNWQRPPHTSPIL